MKVRIKRGLFSLFLLVGLAASAQTTVNISGKITDRFSKPLARVSVRLLNTHATDITDNQGSYSLENILPGDYQLEISALGYAENVQTIKVDSAGNQTFDFQISPSAVQLESVTVTAEKIETPMQKVPVSISVISSTQVQDMRLWNAKDISGIVPNLYSGNSGDDRSVTSIRGITTTSYDPAVATYVDGVNQFSLDTYIPNLADIERIEVLRGPQGTLYGRNAMGGVINIITKKPGNVTTGFVELNVGNYGLQRYNAGIKLPVIKDKLFVGASAVFNSLDGYYKNTYNNQSFDNQDGFGGNYYLRYTPNAKWSVTANVKHQNNRNDGAFPLVPNVFDAFDKPFELSQNAIGKMEDNTFNASLSVSKTGGKVDFTSQTAFQNNSRLYKSPIDGDFSPLDAVTIINDYGKEWNNVKVFTQEFRLNSPGNVQAPFTWTAGAYIFHQYNPVKQATHFGKDAGLLGVPDTDFSTINISKGNNTGFAGYGQVNYTIAEKLTIFGGLRYDYEYRKLAVRGEYQKDGMDDTFVTLPDTSAHAKFNAVSPKLGLQYQFTTNSNLYFSYSRGYRTGGLTQLSSDPSQPPLYPYKPEYSNNFELGVKNYLFNSRLKVNANLFYTFLNDAQVPTLILPDAITVTRNTGSLTSKGAEVELSYKPVKGLQIDYNAGYTDAKYKSLKVSSNGQTVDLDGKYQIYTPDVTSMLALQYSYAFGDNQSVRLLARGEWYYMGRRYFDLANDIRQSPYNLLNTKIGVQVKFVELYFWARNITDKHYIEYGYDFGAVHLAAPRTYGFTLRSSF